MEADQTPAQVHQEPGEGRGEEREVCLIPLSQVHMSCCLSTYTRIYVTELLIKGAYIRYRESVFYHSAWAIL